MKPDGNGPWVALYAKVLSSDTFRSLSLAERGVFLQTLLLAARTEYDCSYGGRTYHLLPGQFITTIPTLAKQCGRGCTEKIVRRTLDKLSLRLTWAHVRADKRADAPSLVTFINWSAYQIPLANRADNRAPTRAPLGQTDAPQSLMQSETQLPLHSSYTDITQTRQDKESPLAQKLFETEEPKSKTTRTAKITYDPETDQMVGLTPELILKLETMYPGVDVAQVLREIPDWAARNRRSDYWGSIKAFCEHKGGEHGHGHTANRGYRSSIEDAVFDGPDYIRSEHTLDPNTAGGR